MYRERGKRKRREGKRKVLGCRETEEGGKEGMETGRKKHIEWERREGKREGKAYREGEVGEKGLV